MTSGHRQIEHTADLAFEVWAPTESELLIEAARGLVGVLASDPTEAASARQIELEGFDREDRLVRFLNEVIYLAVTEGFVMHSAELALEGETHLRASLTGSPTALEGELKAVTYHDLSLEIGQQGCRTVFVVDV